jgi:hypothetical protein
MRLKVMRLIPGRPFEVFRGTGLSAAVAIIFEINR